MAAIWIREVKVGDADDLLKSHADQDVMKHLACEYSLEDLTPEHMLEWINDMIAVYRLEKPDEEYYLAITADDVVIGGIGIDEWDYEKCKIEIGYWLGKSYWGKGYMTLTLKLFLPWVFQKFPWIKEIEAIPFADNAASIRVLEKAGFKFVKRQMGKKHGVPREEIVYSILRTQ